ncbi:hypothetical protein DGWBC_1201 [Dehalogenimonas sp. WBC-2]|nr:hypothetical protein DGWBC_1201 [Dehalogenimonas sp. WBC-2]
MAKIKCDLKLNQLDKEVKSISYGTSIYYDIKVSNTTQYQSVTF